MGVCQDLVWFLGVSFALLLNHALSGHDDSGCLIVTNNYCDCSNQIAQSEVITNQPTSSNLRLHGW